MTKKFCPTCGAEVKKGKYCCLECYYNRKKGGKMHSTHGVSQVAYTKFSNLSEENKEDIEKLVNLTKKARKSRIPVSRLKKVHNMRTFKNMANSAASKVLNEFLEATKLDERKFEKKREVVQGILKERDK